MALASGQITLVDLTDNITSGSIIASSLTVYAGSNEKVTLTCNYSNAENATTTYTWYHSSIDEENRISNTGSTNENTCIVCPTDQGIINGSVLYFCRVSSGSVIQDFQISIQVINKMEYLSITPETFFIDTDINGHFSEGSFTTSEIVINLVDEGDQAITISNPSLIGEENGVSIFLPDSENNKIFTLTLTQEKINSFSNSSDLVSFTFTTTNGRTYEKGISFVKNKIDNRNSGYTVFLTKEVISLADGKRTGKEDEKTHTFTSKIKAFYGNREVEIEEVQIDTSNGKQSLEHNENYIIQGTNDASNSNITGFYFTYDNITKEFSFFHNAKIKTDTSPNPNTFNFYVKLKNKEGYFVLPFTYYLYNYGYQLLYEETNIPFTWNLDLENYNTQAIIVKSLQYSETQESNKTSFYNSGLWDFEIFTDNSKITIENGSSLPVFLSKLNNYSYNINLVKLKEIHGQVRSISVILKSAGAIVSTQNFPVIYGEGSKIGGENLLLNSKDFSDWNTKVNNITLGTGNKQESEGEILIVSPEMATNRENGDFSIIRFDIPKITRENTDYAPKWSYARTPYLPLPKNYINKTFCLSFDVQFNSTDLNNQTDTDFSQNFVVVLSAHKTINANNSHRSRYGILATIKLSNSTYSGLSVIENKNNYSNWQRVALTFTLNEDLLLSTDNEDDEGHALSPTPLDECIGLRVYFHLQDIGTLSIKRPKLELGDTPSEWTDSYGREQVQGFLEEKQILDSDGNLLIVTDENFSNRLAT